MCKQVKEYPILFQGDMVRAILNQKPGVWPAEPIDPALPMKWQTRRIVKPQPPGDYDFEFINGEIVRTMHGTALGRTKCPHGRPGDTLWMRETWATLEQWDNVKPSDLPVNGVPIYHIDDDFGEYQKRPSIFMPRWASRLNLENKRVRVERVQDISDEDAIAEGIQKLEGGNCWKHCDYIDGCTCCGTDSPQASFAKLWDSINGRPKPSKRNPYTNKPEECYTSYPWEDVRKTEQYRGKTHYIVGNPWVWAVDFMRLGK